jgi:hypothetical protein
MKNISYFVQIFSIVFVLTIFKSVYSQSNWYYYDYKPITYNIDKNSKKGYDKFGKKQGYWKDKLYFGDYLLFYKDSITASDFVFAEGFYVDGNKQGIWDIYDIEDYDKRELIAQIFYDEGKAAFQFTYMDNKLIQITRLGFKHRPSNTFHVGDVMTLDIINFQETVEIYRESYTPDGVLQKYIYPKKTCP